MTSIVSKSDISNKKSDFKNETVKTLISVKEESFENDPSHPLKNEIKIELSSKRVPLDLKYSLDSAVVTSKRELYSDPVKKECIADVQNGGVNSLKNEKPSRIRKLKDLPYCVVRLERLPILNLLPNIKLEQERKVNLNTLQSKNVTFHSVKCEKKEVFNLATSSTNKRRLFDYQKRGILYTCDDCGKTFYIKGSLKKHMISKHLNEQAFKCKLCPKTFNWLSSLQEHIKRKSCIRNADSEYKCHICKKSLKNNVSLKKHMKCHTDIRPYQCSYCPSKFKTTGALNLHVTLHVNEGSFKCPLCPRRFTRAAYLKRHEPSHFRKQRYMDQVYICDICKKSFSKKGRLTAHFKSHQDIRPHHCTLCPQKFKFGGTLRLHMKTHVNERKYKCTLCPSKFNVKSTRDKHLKTHAPKYRDYSEYLCHICKKALPNEDKLKVHIILRHCKAKPFYCAFCPRKFKKQTNFNKHFTKKHQSESKCIWCLMKFESFETFQEHLRDQTCKNSSIQKRCVKFAIRFSSQEED